MGAQSEWTEICKAYCRKIGAEFVFANAENGDFGFEINDQFVHMTAERLAEILFEKK